jgi:hypothetical protein
MREEKKLYRRKQVAASFSLRGLMFPRGLKSATTDDSI